MCISIYIYLYIYTSPRNYGVVSCIRGDSRMQWDLDKGISHSTLYHIWGKEKWWICTQFIVILMGKGRMIDEALVFSVYKLLV